MSSEPDEMPQGGQGHLERSEELEWDEEQDFEQDEIEHERHCNKENSSSDWL